LHGLADFRVPSAHPHAVTANGGDYFRCPRGVPDLAKASGETRICI
jgi:hypothetical protein